jgi:nifR3 family TIM-barrel protein
MSSFWDTLPKPFFCLAPLADVTDAAFRRLIAKYGKPHVMFTEFVSADGLCSPGREVLLKDLLYTEAERPIVAQLFTSRPEKMEQAAALARELGFDGVDINMGCPDKSVEKQGAGAALIKSPSLAKEVIAAAKAGAKELPVSVKTRVGYNKVELESWIPALLETGLAALTIHARTRKEMSLVPARWEHVREAASLRNELAPDTLIIGNGDARDIADAKQKAAMSGADGVMLGRAVFGNPWLFSSLSDMANSKGSPIGNSQGLPSEYRLNVMVEHTKLFCELLGEIKSFAVMKKHYKAYVSVFDGAKELRVKLMDANNFEEVEAIVKDFLTSAI